MDPVVKQQASERIRQANEILVTVSANPTVDQLAALIGTTLLLNKLGKHATAIFSGTTPSTLQFLQPEKTIEHNIDNLRDFIVSLDKAKADKLHFKVEDDIVRIYITPYKTSLSEKDLTYSQGEYNVEVVLALGVQSRAQVDSALSAHGRILHDATIIAVTAGAGKPSDAGQINWQDPAASSLCEMMVSISESFGSGLVDAQMATAFLTGIVAETERFRNAKTTPKVMTMSAQLMAAGANQQLIASKLELPDVPVANKPAVPSSPKEATLKVDHPQPIGKPLAKTVPKVNLTAPVNINSDEIRIDNEGNMSAIGSEALSKPKFIPAPPDFVAPAKAVSAVPPIGSAAVPLPDDMPLPGEHTLLDPTQHQPAFGSPLSADTQPGWTDGGQTSSLPPEVTGIPAQPTSQVDQARAAVEQAVSAAAASPATEPAAAPAQAPPLPPPLPDSVVQSADKPPAQ